MSVNNPIPKMSVNTLGRKRVLILRMQHPNKTFEIAVNFDMAVKQASSEVLSLMLSKLRDEMNMRVKNN